VPVIFAVLAASLVTAGVGTWQITEPINTIYNATAPLITKQPSDKNLIDPSSGTTLVGLGIFFAVLAVVALIFGGRGRSPYG